MNIRTHAQLINETCAKTLACILPFKIFQHVAWHDKHADLHADELAVRSSLSFLKMPFVSQNIHVTHARLRVEVAHAWTVLDQEPFMRWSILVRFERSK